MDTNHGGDTAPADPAQDRLSAVVALIGRFFCILFIVSTVISVYEVIMRYAFNAPTIWVHETTTTLTALCFAFGGAYCLAVDKHIRVVLIYDHVGPAARRWMDIGICLICTLVCAMMSYAAWSLVAKSLWTPAGVFRLETSGSAWNPPFPGLVKSFLFLVLVVMTVQFALQVWYHIRRKPDPSAHHGHPGVGVYEDV